MSTYTSTRQSDNTDTDDSNTQRTELSEVRQRLFNVYEYVRDEDPELYREIDQWLRDSVDVPDGSVGEAVKSRLRELKRNNKMRDHRGVDDPEDAFHNDCEGCPHYGVRCPMVKSYSVTKTITRILETAETDAEVIEKLSDLAIENDCHVVLGELDEYQGSHAEFLKAGYQYNRRATAVLSGPSDGLEDPDGVTAEFDETTPPAEAAETLEATVDAVVGEDEDEDEDG